MPILPLDVIEIIVDILAKDEDDPSLPSTKACSLACYDFAAICRKHIFAHIAVNQINNQYTPLPKFGWQHRTTTALFHALLSNSPEIIDHIRSLDYSVTSDDLMNHALLTEMFMKITRLKSFTLRSKYPAEVQWNTTPLRPALLHILDLPTLIDFNVDGVKGFSLMDLARPLNLEEFGFDGLETAPSPLFDSPNLSIKLRSMDVGFFSSGAVLDICEKICTSGEPLVDLSWLMKLTIRLFSSDDLDSSLYLLVHCKRLTSLCFYSTDYSELSFAALSDMLAMSAAAKTLKYLEVHTLYDQGYSEDVYHGLCFELNKMANNNVIEHINIEIFIQLMSDCDRGDEWGMLDKALASGYPKLRRCSITIVFYGNSPVVHGLEDALLRVRDTQFPTLSSSKSLVFDFIIQNDTAHTVDSS